MRVFIGIDLPEDVKQNIVNLQRKLPRLNAKLVEPENLHICLKFLGEVEENKIEKIKKVIDEATEIYEKFDVEFDGIGFFPNKNYIRVIFLEISKGKEILCSLADIIDEKLSNEGFEREKKDFVPHITLARVKSRVSKEDVEKLENLKLHSIFKVDKIKLFSSRLTPHGPIYSVIYEKSLR